MTTTTTNSNQRIISVQELKEKLREAMKHTSLTSLVGEKRHLVLLQPNDTVETCIHKLTEKDVRSAPIQINSSGNSTYHFVDFVDLSAYLLDLGASTGIITSETQLQSLQNKFMETPIDQVANYSKQDSYSILPRTSTVMEAAVELSKGNKRVLILDNENKLVNIVTHTDIINLFKKFIDEQKGISFTSITAQQLQLYGPTPTCIGEDQKAIDAFLAMRKEKTSFVPVVGDDNELLSVVSARDLKILGIKNDFSILALPVVDFIGITRQSSPDDKYPYIWCKSDSSFDLVIKRLKATHVHRLVMINEKKQPTGVINVSNVINSIVN